MSASVRIGFAIGFALAAIFGGAWAWREGYWRPAEEKRADTQTPPSRSFTPQPDGEPSRPGAAPERPAGGAAAPSVAPTTPATPPSATPTPGATPPSVTPPNMSPPSSTRPPNAADAGSTPGSGAAAAAGRAGEAKGAKPDAAKPDAAKGAFDVVRVEPSGDAVVAGRCAAGCTAELTANGRTIDTAKADSGGSFAMTPPALPPGDHQLRLKLTTPDGKQETSEQSVTVSVPKAPSKEVVVVLNAPDAPSQILQRPGQEPAAAEAPKPAAGDRVAARPDGAAPAAGAATALSLGAIDADQGRFFLQGTAPAGSKLRIYLNNSLVSEATAGADGRWSLRVERGLTEGKYTARVDHVDAAGKVVKRAETGFDYEGEVAAAAPGSQDKTSGRQAAGSPTSAPSGTSGAAGPQAAVEQSSAGGDGLARRDRGAPGEGEGASGEAAAPAANSADAAAAGSPAEGPGGAGAPPVADPANPVVASIDTATVKRGDSLWRISRTAYGQGRRYTIIFSANDKQIRDPDLIYPGQVLVVPNQGAEAAAAEKR
ncbi:Ig-like domain-containing protein [Chenggangzhangella methanolivorans]|uniref:Ig-like domain-containing protein n=1 Tax=Chenggangzhangella methanolivorans TaxID=1437009 RepID=UPI003606A140